MSTKYLLLSALLCSIFALGGDLYASDATWGQWQNSLKPQGEPAGEIALAVDGETDYVIVIPAKPTTQEQKAAEELRKWIGQMTGADYAIVSDSAEPIPTEISVGRTNRLAATNLAIADADLGDEGYAIALKDQRLFLIGGKKRGPIYAAFAFMEEDLGLRWYTRNDVNRIPHRPTIRVEIVPRSYVPALQIRDPFWWDAFDATWSLRNRTNTPRAAVPEEWGGRVNYALFVHSFNRLIPPSQYKQDHPEYFGTNQPCLTNPDVLRIVTENTLKILREHPNAELISVSQNDGGGYCTCERCQALDQAEGSHAGTLIKFVNQVADAVREEFPDVKVSTLAYTYTAILPKTVRPRDNIAIRLCTDTCMWSRPFVSVADDKGPVPLEWPYWDMVDDPEKLSFKGFLDDWSAVHDTIHIWDYVINFSHYLAPMPNMDVVRDNIRYFVDHHVTGILPQANYQTTGSERSFMRAWVTAKLLWDPSRDLWNLMQDFIWGYYGKAAPAIVEYNQLLRSLPKKYDMTKVGGTRYPMDSEFLSPQFLARAEAIFDRAMRLAENEEIRRRVELAHLPIIYVKLARGQDFYGEGYLEAIDQFEETCRSFGITRLSEHFTLKQRLDEFREEVRVQRELELIRDDVTLIALPNEWRFAIDPNDVGVSEGWFRDSFDDGGWAILRNDLGLKGWEAQGFPNYDGFGWYRQSFTVPSAVGHQKRFLYFGAVDEQAWVYLNGEPAFEHTCTSTGLRPEQLWARPFLFDAADHLKPSQTNSLAVRVHDQAMMGGVWQPVYVVASDRELDVAIVEALVANQ